ncbi:MAG TPA: 3-deoxy-8-phosphooctulonate synthase [Candidatus Cloacimonadota bacterium]|nr:3-deoxy-8-phosphooctulonate synthase [Candidatus Cloacimonadota bacterium]HPT72818.1 3-deoxy-8-phosphooctulonate synthase [Candidatus Cloacimonadota bacterium]
MDLYNKLQHPQKFFLIAGPCVVEDETLMFETAEFLIKLCQKRDILLIFKSSYQKANRTSETSYTGPGSISGLAILKKIKETFQVPIITDVHETTEIAEAASVADILQIPAFLSRQTSLIHAAAKSGRIINIKKGQFMAPEDMEQAAKKVTSQNNFKVMLTERGTTFGYHNLVVDFRSFAILNDLGFPVIYDVTHSMQRPSILNVSGGTPEYAGMMARAALATGKVQGLFIETHPRPHEAMSDAASMVALEQMPDILDHCLSLF